MPGWGSLVEVLDAIDGEIAKGPYLLGDAVSAADIYIGAQLGYGMMFGIIEKRPTFAAYVARLNARPAAIRARETDDALTAENPVQG
jgi:glutathione S-transferase